MGNYISCSCLFLTYPGTNTAKLIDSTGNSRQVKLPATAGEIMLEEPGYVISSVHQLRRTSRVMALRADDEVVAGEVYLLVSLSRVNGKVTEREMVLVESNGKRSKRKRRGGAKVLPDAGVEYLGEEENSEMVKVLEDMGFASPSGRSMRKGNHQRPWLPVLDTVSEEL